MNWYFPVTWMENLFSYILFWFISEWSSKLFTFFFSQRKYSIIWPLHKNVSYLNNLDGCCCCKYHTIIRLFNLSDCIAIYILLRLVVSQKYCQIWIDIVNQSFEWWFMVNSFSARALIILSRFCCQGIIKVFICYISYHLSIKLDA